MKTIIEVAFELNIPVDQLRAGLKKLGIFPTRDEILSNAIQERLWKIYQKTPSESDKREAIRLKYELQYEALKSKVQEIANASKSMQQKSAIYQKTSSVCDKFEDMRSKFEALKLEGRVIANANKSMQQKNNTFPFGLMPQKEASKWHGGMKCNKCGYLWDTRKRIGLPARCPCCSATSIGINRR
jgi:predicted Zn-ribbon and HTH transcriptional regulator